MGKQSRAVLRVIGIELSIINQGDVTMSKSNWWVAPEDLGNNKGLSTRLDQKQSADGVFKNAEPMTIRIRGVMIRENMEWRPGYLNDIMIVTTSQFGSEPPIQRMHFLKDNVPLGWQGDFFNSTVLALKNYPQEKTLLILRVQVYDIDRVDTDLVNAIAGAASSVAVAFPQLAPATAVTSLFGPALTKLVDNLDNHDRIIDERLSLEISDAGMGRNLLQPGYFVCFREPIESDEGQLQLDHKMQVTKAQDSNKFVEYQDCSYTVLGVERKFNEQPDWEINQKAAKLVAELDGKGQSGKAALDFLKETMSTYDKYKRLERAQVLLAKAKPTQAEKDFLNELKRDAELSKFLPQT